MRLLVTGSRTWDDADYIRRVLDGALMECAMSFDALLLHHGACPTGADQIADDWAKDAQAKGMGVLVARHPAQWRTVGGIFDRGAGFRRNAEMVAAVGTGGDVVCHAFIRDRSGGATHCANAATKAGIRTIRHRWEDRDAASA